jgi:DNA-binding protein H-NS
MPDHDDGKIGAVDLDGMTVQQLTALIAAAEAKRQEKREGAVTALRAEVERKAAELGVSPGELFAQGGPRPSAKQATRGRKPRSDVGAKRAVAVRYRGPNGETWSGRGRTPRWLAALEAEGRGRKEFAVEPEPELGLAQ